MNALIVYTHPVQRSFNRAVLGSVERGLAEAGHVVKLADLYAEDFQCAITPEDFASFDGLSMPPEILQEQARVEWCDAMIDISPIMKGISS
jgi:NAD(P)H dehydrogenase (quinone)